MGLEYSQYLENYLWPHFTVEKVRPAQVSCWSTCPVTVLFHSAGVSRVPHVHCGDGE